jgi:pimeloyl-ACP methyl ester carboxylesterase
MDAMGTTAQGQFVDVHGTPQWVTIRGTDRANPLLLLVGGPGFGYAAVAPFFASFERDFTIVHWDQPGAGFTFGRSRVEPHSIVGLADDGVHVAEFARDRVGAAKVALLAFSGGTLVGLHMIVRRPELFSAYVGTGQFVDWPRQDLLSYELLLARARENGNAAMLADLTGIGPPPYRDTATDAIKSRYAGAPTPREAAAFGALGPLSAAARNGEPAGADYLAPGVDWPEPMPRTVAAYTALRSEIVTFDAFKLTREIAVPMFFMQGAADFFSVTSEVARYADWIKAPHVELMTIPEAGHSALLLRDESLARLRERVHPKLLST